MIGVPDKITTRAFFADNNNSYKIKDNGDFS